MTCRGATDMTIPPDQPPARQAAASNHPAAASTQRGAASSGSDGVRAASDTTSTVTNAGAPTPRTGGGSAAAGAAPGRNRRAGDLGGRRAREQLVAGAICLAAVIGGALITVAPTGNRVADRVLAASFVALMAAAGSRADRWTWFIAAGAALALAGGVVAVAAGVTALLLALASTGPTRPAPAVGAAIGGLSAVALLHGESFWFQGASALLVAAASSPLLLSGYRHATRTTQRRVRRSIVFVVAAVVAVVAMYAVLLAQSRNAAERGLQRLESALDAARDGDDVLAEQRFAEAARSFSTVQRTLGGWWAEPAEVLPVVGHNARAIQAMATTATDLSRQGRRAAADADIDQLTVEGGRLDLERVRALEEPLIDVATTLDGAAARMEAVDTPWLARPVAERVDRVRGEVADAQPDARIAADAVRAVPAIFGGEGETHWLVVFVTPVEARGRSGFPGNFAELVAVDGDVEMTRFGRIRELESGGTPGPERTLTGPADYLARWGRYMPTSTWRNITMSPDFPSIGHVITELYPQSGGGQTDGVIALDPTALAALLDFTGPVTVPGVPEPLTSANAAEFLLVDQYVDLPQTGERIDVLETMARTTFDRLTSGSLPGPRRVADTMGPVVRDGHIQLYSADSAQEHLFTELGADGALPPIDGDFLAVMNNNGTGNKVDRFLSRDIDYHAAWDPSSGAVIATVKVTLVNDAPRSGLPDYIIGNSLGAAGADLPKGTNRTQLSVYSPLMLEGADVDGRSVEITPEVERDRYAYSLFVDVPPEGGMRTVTLKMRGRIAMHDGDYRLHVAGQPLVTPDRLRVRVESAAGGPLNATPPMDVDGATAEVAIRLSGQEKTFHVEADE
jgi:hypothetical protein